MATVCGEIWRVRVSILPEATLHQPKSFHPSLLSLFLTIHFFSFFFFKFSSPHFLFFLSVCSTSFFLFCYLFPAINSKCFDFLAEPLKAGRATESISGSVQSSIEPRFPSPPARPPGLHQQPATTPSPLNHHPNFMNWNTAWSELQFRL